LQTLQVLSCSGAAPQADQEVCAITPLLVVERAFGWMNHSRRLSKSHERLTRTDETWIYIAMPCIMLKRLA